MLTLYYGPGACSMASHIVLEESGEKYEPRNASISPAASSAREEYQKINPHGRVPALEARRRRRASARTPRSFPISASASNCGRPIPRARSRALSLIGWFASTVHPAHGHVGRPERYAADPAAHASIKETGLKTFHAYLKEIDQTLAGRQWFGDQYSVLDPYGFVFYTWGVRRELPMGELKNYTAFKDRMVARPAVQRVLEDEKVKV